MKIIQVIPSFRLGGAETMCENLTGQLLEMGHELIVACLYDTDSPITKRLLSKGVDIRFCGKRDGLDISMIGKLLTLFKAEKPDVVHTHTHTIQYAMPAARLAGVPALIHTVHNIATEDQVKTIRVVSGYFFRHWGVVPVALSERIKETVIDEYRLPPENIPVIFNGIDLSRCTPKEDYSADNGFSILHIGRFDPQKNHAGLIEAFSLFHRDFPNSTLSLIGAGSLRPEMEALAAKLKLEDSLRFLGERGSVYEYLSAADLFALPSNFEGMPMTLIEAMGSALPIVATAVGGVPDMLTDGESAWLVSNEPEAIAAAFRAAASNQAERERRGLAALAGSQLFSAGEMARQYAALYRKQLGGRQA